MQSYDAVIIGAGISGISAAYHFQKNCPGKTYKILERRAQLGGTWDLFNYPGVRSDSDMYTFGFSFRPWKDKAAIAKKEKILDYLQETAVEYGIDKHIQFGLHIQRAEWSSSSARWTVSATDESTGEQIDFSSRFIFMCVGYYNYDRGYAPQFAGQETFDGDVLHPQFWPADAEYKDKNVVIIGSGATAITMLPAMSEQAKHVTMLQRSPTYMGSKPAEDPIANRLSKWLGHWAARWWFILSTMFLYVYCRLFPARSKKIIVGEVEKLLGDKFDANDYTPHYKPWDQRVCLCPDADFFEAIKADKASVETGHIDRFTARGIRLKSGKELPADIIVTATGLEMLFLGGIELVVDGKTVEPSQIYVYKGLMLNGIPNMFIAVGYTNASWTLKVDLTHHYACRLINHMDKHEHDFASPEASADLIDAPLLDLSSGYVQRALSNFPKQATKTPWKLYQNFILDNVSLRLTSVDDGTMTFHTASSETTSA